MRHLLSGCDRVITLTNSQQFCLLAQGLHKIKWVGALALMEKGQACETLLLVESIVTIDGYWGRRSHFSSECGTWWVAYTSVDGLTLMHMQAH